MKYLSTVTTLLGAVSFAAMAQAADLGGDCCADLEERVAELEATVAKKGTRKTSLTIHGQVSRALVYTDVDEYSDYSIGENSNAPSFVGFAGQHQLNPNLKIGFKAELGWGGYEAGILSGGYGHLEGDTNGLYVRRSSVYIDSKNFGRVTVGKDSQATDGISSIDVTNSRIASTPLTLRPLTGPGIGEALELFDGARANVVRYDSPEFGGFRFSGSFAPSNFDVDNGDTDGSVFDVAMRYAGEFGSIRVAAGVGYRNGIAIEDDALIGVPLAVALDGDPSVFSGSASIQHVPTGLFLNGTYGHMDIDSADVDVTGWSLKGGIEQKLISAGKTTVFAEYGDWNVSDFTSEDVDYWGLGLVQNLGPVDLYVSGRQYDFLGEDITTAMAGMTVKF